jgi:glycerophosphoryl diester phosphodiesterase
MIISTTPGILGLLCLAFLSSQGYSQTQDQRSYIQPNGVTVYMAPGVEGYVSPAAPQPVAIMSVNEWNLAQCIDALPLIDAKIAVLTEEGASQEELEKLRQVKLDVEARRSSLISQKPE